MTEVDAARLAPQIERLVGALDAAGDAPAAAEARELVHLVLSFHRAALERLLEILRTERGGPRMSLERIAEDPLLASVLALHDLQEPRAAATPLLQIQRPARASTAEPPAHEAGSERCELCGAAVTQDHAHLLDVQSRRLLCACEVCRNTGGKYRLVPTRYLHEPSMTIPAHRWEALGVPVGLAFFVISSQTGSVTASYPGPAGATESVLPLDAWPGLAAEHPWMARVTPDVEALLVRRAGDVYVAYVVPIDACYELIGRIRKAWSGMSGGGAVQQTIDEFFAGVAARASGPEVRA